jgi:hypothetical protein
MFIKTTVALAIIFGTASAALAATKQHSITPRHDVYDTRGAYVGSDPDANLRFQLRRDWERGQQ